MTTFTASPATASVRRSGWARAGRFGLWTARILLSAQFVIGGVLKLAADPTMVAMFDDIGAGQGLRLLVGVCELAGAIGLFVPRLARFAAIGLVGLMAGAAVTNVAVLQTSPVMPLVLLALATVVAAARTRQGGAR